MTQRQSMARAVRYMDILFPERVAFLRLILNDSRKGVASSDGTVNESEWDVGLRIAQASEQLILALNHWEELKQLRERESKEDAESTPKDFITIYKAVGGWQSAQMTWVIHDDIGGLWEPEQTGMGPYATRDEAVNDAQAWAKNEGLEFKEPKDEQTGSEPVLLGPEGD